MGSGAQPDIYGPYPLLTVLSTNHNQTYISTSPTGSQAEPCPPSYTYTNDDYDSMNPGSSNNLYTYNGSYNCKGYYDLSTSAPIYFETPNNFTGSPENVLATTQVQAAGVEYGSAYMNLVLPEVYNDAGVQNDIATVVAHYSTSGSNATAGSGPMLGFVNTNADQVVGLGLNSTFINYMYETGRIASRSVGLYYGVPASVGRGMARNGTLVLGGYSTSRLLGNLPNESYPIGAWKSPRQCPWEIDISSITPASSFQSVASGKAPGKFPFTACIDLTEPQLVLPASTSSFLNNLKSSDLNITLSSGLNITIPSSLVSIRAETDADQSPILGVPFLSQVYLFADYQAKTLAVGLADNTLPLIVGRDQLRCVQHDQSMGNLGWAVGSPGGKAVASNTATAAGTQSTTKKSGARRLNIEIALGVVVMVESLAWLM